MADSVADHPVNNKEHGNEHQGLDVPVKADSSQDEHKVGAHVESNEQVVVVRASMKQQAEAPVKAKGMFFGKVQELEAQSQQVKHQDIAGIRALPVTGLEIKP